MTLQVRTRNLESYRLKIRRKAPNTQKQFELYYRSFDKFCQNNYDKNVEDLIDEMKLVSVEDSCDIIQEWINSLDLKGISIRMYFSGIYPYLWYRGVKIASQDIKQNIVFPRDIQEELHPLSLAEYRMILEVANYKNRTKYLCMGSAGLRPIEINNIRKKDLEIKERIIVHVPAIYTKLKRAKTSFFSIEAQHMLMPLLEKLNPDDKIFGITTGGNSNSFAKYRKKVGLDQRYDSTGRGLLNPMSFRSWFISKMSRKDPNLAKKWAGQKGYMLQYDRMTLEEQLEKYIEFEPELLVYDTTKRESKIEKEYKKKMDLMWKFFQNMKKD